VLNAWSQLIFFLNLGNPPARWVILLEDPRIDIAKRFTSHERGGHKLRISRKGITPVTIKPRISGQHFLPALKFIHSHNIVLNFD
jgi:hypothetical protein